MPRRGYKKPEARTVTLRFRATPEEAETLLKASQAATKRGLSDWLRTIALAEAERLGRS
jgi:hypothetical protein